ncbi:MAG TPA: allophanate hydrolase [Halieaceae bacterium]|jgi:KipI family sensor histidine kinase inhibitor|uniref:5-oxoprolinase subunit PxpB n=1 Tax=Haliea TaxID=475794 RepID=UPI000C600DCF|nr:5-oxoprolinase subunit PxpB [Haliea sp.]HBM84345.1 allophanate hydrolase [Halieaceae bacterium]MAY93617.1 allophanate hydrolase [Haliea sp.]MBK41376.1 allophanate hydrolase [Haliea sp.]MBP70227.1 allophanate hydrolase [Haliea sp.]HBQ39774.1 allophanate hydrolase [Halieaceae bacterium]|tara:strand:+ start:71789 stop:72487 length:699 start_codon:yes stop_codon:yes gene_type:complete
MMLKHAGENAVLMSFAEDNAAAPPGPREAAQVRAAAEAARAALQGDLIDLVPSYASLLVIYDALRTDHFSVVHRLQALQGTIEAATAGSGGREIELPVYYSPETGADLERLAREADLTVDEVITLHCATQYTVYAIGFAPGFAYLGHVDSRIAAPRLTTPRQRVPRGAVAIADRQTAVYPAVSPGGWNLIGNCPQRLFDPHQEPPMPVAVGDSVRFVAIDRQRFLELGGELA